MNEKQPRDFAYDAWCRNAGKKKLTLLQRRRISEWVPEFYRLMRNRLIMGSFRYEPFEEKRKHPWKYDTATEALVRIKRYQETGNIEHLVDAANMCLLEFEFGNHPNKHFSPIDDGEHTKERTE
jgi:hypothetical protein